MAASPEYEIRVLHFNKADVLRRAKALGARPAVTTLLINTMYEAPGRPDTHVRVRSEVTAGGVRTLLTVKTPPAPGERYERESETAVSDAAQLATMAQLLGWKRKHTMHKFRDVIEVPGLGEIDLDSHPGLPPLLEVECPSEAKLRRLVRALGLTMPPAGAPLPSPQALYAELYGVSDARDKSGDLTFHQPSNLRQHVTRDAQAFQRRLAAQRARADRLMRRHGLM